MKQIANTKHSYVVMRLDFMLDRYTDYGWIDLAELHEFVVLYRQLPPRKQRQYAFLLDQAAELFDAAEQPEGHDAL